jgi:hypothetical protein
VKKIKSSIETAGPSVDPLVVSEFDTKAQMILRTADTIPDAQDPLVRSDEHGTTKENHDISIFLKKVMVVDVAKDCTFQTRIC